MERESTNRFGLHGKPRKEKRTNKTKELSYCSEKRSGKEKIMALTLNKEYYFISKEYSNMVLNVYGTSSVANGRNVCLYEKDENGEDKMQLWKYQYDSGYGNRLHCVQNADYVLDRSSGMTNSCANNAHTYKKDLTGAAESAVTFVAVSGETNVYRIRLTNRVNNEFLFLTAANNNGTLPASAITSSNLTTANKNVYWAAEAASGAAYRKQCWEAEEYTSGGSSGGGETSGTPQKLVGPYIYSGITNDYQSEVVTSKCGCYGYNFHYGTDFGGRTNTSGTKDTTIKASGRGVVVDKRDKDYNSTALGQTLVVKYDNVLDKNGANIGDVYFRYCHLASIAVKKDEVVSASTLLGERGHSGTGCPDNQPHLHLEATTNPEATASNSQSEKGGLTDSQKFDVRNVLYTKTSTTGIGKRECMVDHSSPFNSNIYCSHGNAWYSLDSFPSYD